MSGKSDSAAALRPLLTHRPAMLAAPAAPPKKDFQTIQTESGFPPESEFTTPPDPASNSPLDGEAS